MQWEKGLRVFFGLIAIFCVFLFVFGCGRPAEGAKQAETPAAPASPVPAEQPRPIPSPGAVVVPADVKALVTFVSGDVEALRGPSWGPVGIGDSVSQDATLKVREKSFCEIQFGNTGVIRITENTEVVLERIYLSAAGNQVGVKLDAGSVLAKVVKLGGQDKFQVRTGVAVCGVRGTEFGVTSGRDGRTVLKVKSGQVTVLPSTADVEMIGRKAETDERSRELIRQAVAQVVESAPVVQSNQEIVVTRDTVRRTESLIAVVEREITQLIALAPDKPEEKDKKIEDFAANVARQVSIAMAKPAALTEANKKTLEVIETMTILDLPEPAPQAAAPAQPQPRPEAKPNLRTLSITTVPDDAEILLDSIVVGRGDLKRILPEGTKITFRIRREGYEPKELYVDVTASADLDFKVELVPKPREVTIQADPADADILVGGTVVGRGTYKGAFTPGTEVKIGVRKAGFEEKTLDVRVTMDMAPVLRIALGKVSKEVRISVEPRDARIFLGASPLGTGSYQGIHNAGDRLVLRFQREGYQEQTRTLEVTEQGDNTVTAALDRLRKTLTVNAEPGDAQITLNGRPAGRGTFSDTFDYGASLVFEVAKEGYVSKTLRLEVDERLQTSHEVRLDRDRRDITVSVAPTSSSILLDGRAVGRGTYQGRHAVGDVLNFSFQNDGYMEKSLKVEVSGTGRYQVELEAKPVYARLKAASAKIVGLAPYGGDRLIGSDAAGKVFCVSQDGRVQWTAATANTPNESSVPVVLGDRVYFSGAKEFVIIDAANGTVLVRQALDSASANLFGRRVTAHPRGILFPANQNILVKDAASGDTLQTFKTGGDCMMTPLLHRDRIYIADQLGKVHILHAETGQEEAVISTQALQPVAQAIQVAGSAGFFAGRRGNVVAVDLDKKTVLWQTRLAADNSATVFHDAVVSGSAVFIFSKNMIYALNSSNGAPLYDPIKDASAPPLLFKDMLYIGTMNNQIIMHSPAGNRTEKTLTLNARVSTRPEVYRDEYIAVGTQEGEVIIVNPKGIR
jgi:outer membrane protein assembly factor BamB